MRMKAHPGIATFNYRNEGHDIFPYFQVTLSYRGPLHDQIPLARAAWAAANRAIGTRKGEQLT